LLQLKDLISENMKISK